MICLAYYSFPSTTNEIKIYSRLGNIDYYKAKELANNGSIENVVQIGFYLSGDVTDDIGNRYNIESDSKTTYKVSIIFDAATKTLSKIESDSYLTNLQTLIFLLVHFLSIDFCHGGMIGRFLKANEN